MIGLLQRVRSARVEVKGDAIGVIKRGLLVFIGIEWGDASDKAGRLPEFKLGYHRFPDAAGKRALNRMALT